MPLFDWTGLDAWGVLRAVMFATSPGDAAAARIATDTFRAGVQADEAAEAKLARSRWLERHDAESTFPCGVVPEPEPPAGAPRLNVVPSLLMIIGTVRTAARTPRTRPAPGSGGGVALIAPWCPTISARGDRPT